MHGSGRDLFGHLPGLINSSTGGSMTRSGSGTVLGSSTEALKTQRLEEILRDLEAFSSAASGKH